MSTVYRVTGANDLTFRKEDQAIACAARWLEIFGNVWVTAVTRRDRTLHFVLYQRSSFIVSTSDPHRGDKFTQLTSDGYEALIRSSMEHYDLL